MAAWHRFTDAPSWGYANGAHEKGISKFTRVGLVGGSRRFGALLSRIFVLFSIGEPIRITFVVLGCS